MIGIKFNDKAERAVKAAEEAAAKMVTEITAETEAALRATIVKSMASGSTVYDTAKNVKKLIGLTTAQASAAENYRDKLDDAGSLTATQIDKEVESYADELLTARSENIARTEVMDALNAGQSESFTQAQADGFLNEDATKEWIVTDDDKLCPECAEMDGKTVPVTEEFPEGDPPLHPNCRCTIAIGEP